MDTLADTLAEAQIKTLGDTLGDVEAEELIHTLHDTPPEWRPKHLRHAG